MSIFYLLLLHSLLIAAPQGTSIPLANPELASGWTRIAVKDVGTIDVPPTLENTTASAQSQDKSFGITDVMFAAKSGQKNAEGADRYAVIKLQTEFHKAGDEMKLSEPMKAMSGEELQKLNASYRTKVEASLVGTDTKVLSWYSLRVDVVAGMYCMHVSYQQQLKDKSIAVMNLYTFQNYDRIHCLTFGYRASEGETWRADFAKVLASFRITNIRG
jgi:hypothetical protein